MKVLLVEDNPGDARLFVELVSELVGRPFAVTTVGTLGEAKQRATEHDVVFLDLSLPDAHGIATLAQLVSSDRSRPIVVLTGNDDDAVAMEAMKAGAQDFLRKSEITPSLIARAARYAIERKTAEENAHKLVTAEQQARRAQFLASVTAAATSSLDRATSLAQVARAVLPALGDGCIVDLIEGAQAMDADEVERGERATATATTTASDGSSLAPRFERLAFAAASEDDNALVEQLVARFVPTAGSPVLVAASERKTVTIDLSSDLPSDLSRAAPPGDDFARAVAECDVRAVLVTPLVARGRVIGAITYATKRSGRTYDENVRLLAEEVAERVALGIDNAILYERAQRAIRGRDELMAVVSHDLRNPLGVVALALQMLADDPNAVAVALPRAQRAVERMVRLIEDLLDVARIDAGTLSVDLKPVELAALLDDLCEQHRVLAAEKRIELVQRYNGNLGTPLLDRHRVGQALANLVGNALKLTPKGGRIELSAERTGDRLAIAVSDTGPGIAPEHRAHLFDRFWQPERRRDGVGLGLAIVKGIVDAHGGTVEVDSVLGAGSTFRIVLPADGATARAG